MPIDQTDNRVSARSSWLRRFLMRVTGGATRIAIDLDTILFERAYESTIAAIDVGAIENVTLMMSLFGRRLTVAVAGAKGRSIDGLSESDSRRVRDEILHQAEMRATQITEEMAELDITLSSPTYLRHREGQAVYRQVLKTIGACGGQLVHQHLDEKTRRAYDRIRLLGSSSAFEDARLMRNERLMDQRIPAAREAARLVLDRPLTQEQALAIVTDEDATLVLAGAGTGKTAIIVSKVADLVKNRAVSPDEILVLAFNNRAVAEIRARLPESLAKTNVATFHKFGLDAIGAATSRKPMVSALAESDHSLVKHMQKFLDEMVLDSRTSDRVVDFLFYHAGPYKSVFDFPDQREYDDYVRDVRLITLNGEHVKSYEELTIANFLARNGIAYRYEQPYEFETATADRRQYQPDFYLVNYGIYIEHFALDKRGRAPRIWVGYERGVEWKRRIHSQHQTSLIETYSWQHQANVLLETLQRNLESRGVDFRPLPANDLLERLRGTLTYSWLATFCATFLNHFKTQRLTIDDLRENALEREEQPRHNTFLDIFEIVSEHYANLLNQQKKIDFHDMINAATDHIQAGRWTPSFNYVLVDEFQDVSSGRIALLQALKREATSYFLVGDDWQSIYRFAGSDVTLLKDCDKYLGHVERRTVSQTFRFGDGIQRVSTEFVTRNPDQTQRQMRANSMARNDGVTVVGASDHSSGLQVALNRVSGAIGSRPCNILVLGRYRDSEHDLNNITVPDNLKLEFSTVHAAKGREADYVVVLDLVAARRGFPSGMEDDPLLELVLPQTSVETYEYAEERRLFYVAVTRARYGAFLVTNPATPSQFIVELLQESPGIQLVGERISRKCPECNTGFQTLRHRRSDGKPFWGCTNYFANPRCGFTRDAPDQATRQPRQQNDAGSGSPTSLR